MSSTWTLARLSTPSPTVVLLPSWGNKDWMGGRLGEQKPVWVIRLRQWLTGYILPGGLSQVEFFRALC